MQVPRVTRRGFNKSVLGAASLSFLPGASGRNLLGADDATGCMTAGNAPENPPGITFFYGDWGMQDWTPPERLLTEEMTLRALARFREWRETYGFGPDYYVIDVMWFDRKGDYTQWNPVAFPGGPEKALQEMRGAGLKLGLWYATNSGNIDANDWLPANPAWRASYNPEFKGYCYSHGPYLQGLRDAWEFAYENWGLRAIKLDALDLSIPPPGQPRSPVVTVANIRAFRNMIVQFRRDHQDVKILSYVGLMYNYDDLAGNTLGPPLLPTFNPEWLATGDWFFTGEPRPSDWPTLRLRRSIDFYQDHLTRRYHWAGVPLDRIDDDGCFFTDSTGYYQLGRTDWRASWMLNLLNGGRKLYLYGDPTLATDDDVQWMKETYQRANFLYTRGASPEVLGGFPAAGEPFGYRLTFDGDGFLLLGNPSWKRITYRVPFHNSIRSSISTLASDGASEVPIENGVDFAEVGLGPNQMVLLGLGREGEKPLPSKELTPGPWPRDLLPVTPAAMKPEAPRRIYRVASLPKGSTVYWVLRFKDREKRVRWDYGNGWIPIPARPLAEQLQIKTEGGRLTQVLPDRWVWAGISWLVVTVKDAAEAMALSLVTNKAVKDYEVEAYVAKES